MKLKAKMIQNYFVYSLNKKWRQLKTIGAIWLSDLNKIQTSSLNWRLDPF
ncbi:hypothetical protein NU08_3567 [Flavobacterium anhuiense]|uniref:Uncharacterized protein n=1 Tax=Flavobacterium anhuiense TaxID=459526 RepID=A0A444VVS2_9FLAO|nr:hypothetical protein [Flavobacterium anhuiense]RYJ37396.1 hypothetical protein NU08_3567 [Flavobacterium anhuiense]